MGVRAAEACATASSGAAAPGGPAPAARQSGSVGGAWGEAGDGAWRKEGVRRGSAKAGSGIKCRPDGCTAS